MDKNNLRRDRRIEIVPCPSWILRAPRRLEEMGSVGQFFINKLSLSVSHLGDLATSSRFSGAFFREQMLYRRP